MAGNGVTQAGILRAARRIGCDAHAVRAVLTVETAGHGFLADGRPAILFERHIFSRLTERKFDGLHPDLANPIAGGYSAPVAEYGRFYRALQLDAEAAVQSCSWGIGQIMGFNWRDTGEKSLMGFVIAMHHDTDTQLALMAEFIVAKGLDAALRDHKWAVFAKGYNGVAFARNKYDTKLAAAYATSQRMFPAEAATA